MKIRTYNYLSILRENKFKKAKKTTTTTHKVEHSPLIISGSLIIQKTSSYLSSGEVAWLSLVKFVCLVRKIPDTFLGNNINNAPPPLSTVLQLPRNALDFVSQVIWKRAFSPLKRLSSFISAIFHLGADWTSIADPSRSESLHNNKKKAFLCIWNNSFPFLAKGRVRSTNFSLSSPRIFHKRQVHPRHAAISGPHHSTLHPRRVLIGSASSRQIIGRTTVAGVPLSVPLTLPLPYYFPILPFRQSHTYIREHAQFRNLHPLFLTLLDLLTLFYRAVCVCHHCPTQFSLQFNGYQVIAKNPTGLSPFGPASPKSVDDICINVPVSLNHKLHGFEFSTSLTDQPSR